MTAIPFKQIDLEASYSYTYKEKNAGEGRRPTQKSEATIFLEKEGDALVGEVIAEDVAAYKERFLHKVDL